MSINNSMETQNLTELPPEYISGFVDGEGCFGLQFRKDIRHKRPGSPVYYSWRAQFTIVARKDERVLFERIKDFFRCGNIYNQLDTEIHYAVTNLDELKGIISPFFKRYQLQGKKKNDFDLWTEAVDILYKNKKQKAHIKKGIKGFVKNVWDSKDSERMLYLHSQMQQYKSHRPKGLKHIHIATNSIIERI
jgi:hypothetical protein